MDPFLTGAAGVAMACYALWPVGVRKRGGDPLADPAGRSKNAQGSRLALAMGRIRATVGRRLAAGAPRFSGRRGRPQT